MPVKQVPAKVQAKLKQAHKIGQQRRKVSKKAKDLGAKLDELRKAWRPYLDYGDVVVMDDGTTLEIDGWANTSVAYEGVVTYLQKWLPDEPGATVLADDVRSEIDRQLEKATKRSRLLYPKEAEMENATNRLTREAEARKAS